MIRVWIRIKMVWIRMKVMIRILRMMWNKFVDSLT